MYNDIDQWDLAKAFKRALRVFVPTRKPQGGRPAEGYSWLAEQIGCSEMYIREHLDILDPEIVSPEIQTGMKTGEIPFDS